MNHNTTRETRKSEKHSERKAASRHPEVVTRPKRKRIGGAFHWNRGPKNPWGKAIGASLSLGIPFMLGALFNRIDLALLASIGGFTALYVHNEPYSQRAIKLMLVNVGLVLSFGIGMLASNSPIDMAIAFAVVSGSSTFFSGAFKIPPPAGYFFVLVCAVGTIIPFDPSAIPFRMGIALLGGCLAWLIGMAGWLWNPYRQEQLAVKAVYRSLAAYFNRIGKGPTDLERHNLTVALKMAEDAVLTSPFRRIRKIGKPLYLVHLIEKANDLFLLAVGYEVKKKESLDEEIVNGIRHLSKAVAHFEPVPPELQTLKSLDSSSSDPLLQALKEVAIILKEKSPEYTQLIKGQNRRLKYIFLNAIDRTSVVLPASFRISIAVLVASLLSIWLGNTRPYWVSLACASALQGATTLAVVQRTLQRTIGTAVGILIGGFILFIHISSWELVVLMMLFQFSIELLLVRNYTLAVMLITPMALIITFFSHVDLSTPILIGARLIDTMLGAAVALVAGLVLWHRTSSSRLPKLLSSTLLVAGELLRDLLQEKDPGRERFIYQRRRLLTLLTNLRTVYDGSINEFGKNQEDMESYWLTVVSTERLGFFLVAASENLKAECLGTPARLAQIEKDFKALADYALYGKSMKPDAIAPIPEYPGINKEIRELLDSLSIIKGV